MFKAAEILVALTIVVVGISDAFQFGHPINNHACSPSRVVLCSSLNGNGDTGDVCGEGFATRTGPDGEYCSLDFEAVAEHPMPASYWDGLARQNASRKKFGQPPLTPEQYVALQAQNRSIGEKRLNDAILLAFSQFDANDDGVVTLKELKLGLEGVLRMELTETSVRKVMEHFDTSGDGLLQPDEFVTTDRLRVQLEAVAKEEQRLLDASSQGDSPMGIFGGFLKNLSAQFESTCESNFDCDRPEVCCDLGFRKMCCSSGSMAKNLQLEYAYATIPASTSTPASQQFW
mmetsp:Transcript_3761/g.7872  ORF Transcript_3761/g.7872 Transcript_3761/m.7872 type:complete len:288 (-) Transcript_3761:282-1145(-)|eukprot:CAMPEP_0194305956 /NCGR_PEP_ID=MMETSP0171-20130528/3258_1 /TAXON_ID=218684 /ORGANISM="Corethron pennatum, Strain L29A3" /LENGTH=287 /DNA_ID=CAMNT_0039057625 /DNA_START=48 /DNA_END=911 /DNA_ORIENTATION=+